MYSKIKNDRYSMWYAIDEIGEICYVSLFEDKIDEYVARRNKLEA